MCIRDSNWSLMSNNVQTNLKQTGMTIYQDLFSSFFFQRPTNLDFLPFASNASCHQIIRIPESHSSQIRNPNHRYLSLLTRLTPTVSSPKILFGYPNYSLHISYLIEKRTNLIGVCGQWLSEPSTLVKRNTLIDD